MAEEFNYQNQQNADVQNAVNNAMQEQKKKKRKKRLIILAVAVVIVIGIVALTSGGESEEKTTSSSEISVTSDEEVEGKIGDYICVVKEAKLCKNWEGKDSVKITYSFTNNASDAESFDIALDDNVYQEGVGLESTWIGDDDDFGIDVKIMPGTTKDVVKVYELRDTSTDLEIEIGQLISFDDTKITTTVKIEK